VIRSAALLFAAFLLALATPGFVCAADTADAEAPQAPAQETQGFEPLLGMDSLQKRILYARLLIENGHIRRGLARYRRLVREHPQRDDVRAGYVRALVELGRVDAALGVLRPWLARDPDNPDALRLAAEAALARDDPGRAALYFEHLSRLRPRDATARADAAFARQEAGDELRALRLFSESLDLDPDQPAARQAVREALLARRPRLVGEAGVLKQDGDAYTYSGSAGVSVPLLETTRLEAAYEHASITRPQEAAARGLDKELDQGRLTLRQALGEDLELRLGGGAFAGFKSGFSQRVGLEWRPMDWGSFEVEGKRNQPWYDEIEATRYSGSYNEVLANLDGFVDDWGFFAEAGLRRYYLSPWNLYGTRYRFNGAVTRRLLDSPELLVSYSYYITSFTYRHNDQRPLDMVENEALHMLTASAGVQATPWLRAVLAVGGGQDQFKTKPTWMAAPRLEATIGPRVELTAGFEYRSQSDRIGGGETMNANFGFRITF
jgi:Flp pilus assembly protein TadD